LRKTKKTKTDTKSLFPFFSHETKQKVWRETVEKALVKIKMAAIKEVTFFFFRVSSLILEPQQNLNKEFRF
jgi:hypothetical protein